MLNGGYNNTLDDKGRITFPAALHRAFSGDLVIVTRGAEKCLWVFPPESWKVFSEKYEKVSAEYRNARILKRHYLGWAVEAEIDKSSRLSIPQELREYAGLTRKCTVMGVGDRIEIWDEDMYREVNEESEGGSIIELTEEFADKTGV
ncbi:transcriptional regulator MraZ [Spirochaetia bacterium]|nr:transcriptional regulator MraZ [Spirochaetia bacterium]